jgi:hypothetical protein
MSVDDLSEEIVTMQVQGHSYPKFDIADEIFSFRLNFPGHNRVFYVNPTYMAQISDYFAKICLDENFREANDGEVVLVEDDPDDILELLRCIVPRGETWLKPVSSKFARYFVVNNIPKEIFKIWIC